MLTEEQLRSPAYASTGDAMAARERYDACASAENLARELLDILIVVRKSLCEDKGDLPEDEKAAVLTVVAIAEKKAREARVAAARATELTGWSGR